MGVSGFIIPFHRVLPVFTMSLRVVVVLLNDDVKRIRSGHSYWVCRWDGSDYVPETNLGNSWNYGGVLPFG